MITWLLITGLMSGAGSQAVQEAVPPSVGGGGKTYAQSRGAQVRYEQAAQEWLDRTQARVLPDLEPNTPETSAPKTGGKIQTTTQVAQDALRQPRTAEPAPLDWTALDALLQSAEAYRLAEAQWLRAAMLDRQHQALANAAWQAGIALKRAQDDEAVAVILLLAA